jgi:hypothetical protein
MPRLDVQPCDGRLPTHERLSRDVANHLSGRNPADAVIALTDVYTGANDFTDALDAKTKMRSWVANENRFHPHAAQHDFEAWLIPYWSDIKRLAGSNRNPPNAQPENVNHNKSPAYHLREVFRTGSKGKAYVKPRDAARILYKKDLTIAANACPTLKAFLNTILQLCGGKLL